MATSPISGNRGLYQTACEASPNKTQIDAWINEGKSNAWISRELKRLYGEKISDKSIGKYREYRETRVMKELENDPEYQRKMQLATQTLVDQVSKVKPINIINHLNDTIDHCTELLAGAKLDEIKIKTVQDMRFIYMTLMEALKMQSDLVMKAQQFQKIEENPDLLRPTVNLNVKAILVDILKGVSDDGARSAIIDRIRAGIGKYEQGGHAGYPVEHRSGILDGESENVEGTAVLISES